jgi:hypothetical protein
MCILWREKSHHESATPSLQKWLRAQQPSEMGQGRNCDAWSIALSNVLTGLLVKHPLRQRELRSVRQTDLNVVTRHDVESADDCDFFANLRMESIKDFR